MSEKRAQVAQEAARNLHKALACRINQPCELYQMMCEAEAQQLSSLSAENQE